MDDYLKKLVESLTPSNGTSNLAMEVQGTNSFVQAFRASADTIARQPNYRYIIKGTMSRDGYFLKV
jgi:hypothetical protein